MSNVEPQDGAVSEVCYKHADRSTGVSCQRCDRLICGECAHQASVGVHCPECTKGTKQKVYTARTLPGARALVTRGLIGANVVVFLATIAFLGADVADAGTTVYGDYGTWGPPIAEQGELWRIISGGFLHSGVPHIGFNMYLLWRLGAILEQIMGERDYLVAYVTALIGGSLGALFLSPLSPTVGASGAVFGLLGMLVMRSRSKNIRLMDTSLGFIVVVSLVFSFGDGISLGGHLGGFATGLLIGAIHFGVNAIDRPLVSEAKQRLPVTIGLGAVLFGLSYLASQTWSNPLFQALS